MNTAYRTDASDSFAFKFLDGICTTVIEVDNLYLCVPPSKISQRPWYQDLLQVDGSLPGDLCCGLLWGLGDRKVVLRSKNRGRVGIFYPKQTKSQDWRIQSKITLFVFLRYLTLHNGGVALAQAHGASFIIFVLQLVPPLLPAIPPNVSWKRKFLNRPNSSWRFVYLHNHFECQAQCFVEECRSNLIITHSLSLSSSSPTPYLSPMSFWV